MTIFGEFGPVISAEHVADRFDPMRKRGFCFVVFETKEGAQAAVDALNGERVRALSFGLNLPWKLH